MKAQSIYENLTALLYNREWHRSTATKKYDIFIPPAALGFSEEYKLYVYNRFESPGYDRDIQKSLEIIGQIYEEDIDELNSIVVDDRQILVLHIENDEVHEGHPSIPFFETLIRKSKELLHEVANFSMIQKPHFYGDSEEAERYLNYCTFLKNDAGSLITKIQLPNKEEIKENTLFENAITGKEINQNLLNVTSFINTQVIDDGNFDPTDHFLLANKPLISVNIANKLKDLYTGIDFADIEISLKGTQTTLTTVARNLTKEKMGHLTAFSRTVRERMKEISENDVYGKIVQLSSKDVDGERNSIIIEGEIKRVKSRISVPLSSEEIKEAAEAFKSNRTVAINAIFEKEKTQYKVVELKAFRTLAK